MLNIYQEFVRNHQYSLQILAHCKQNRDFDKLLKHYEAKPDCEERTLETFLTYPMFQVRSGAKQGRFLTSLKQELPENLCGLTIPHSALWDYPRTSQAHLEKAGNALVPNRGWLPWG